MANQWLRLWHDMPTDPKWRTIAKASGQRIGDVMAVYCHLLVCASNATERGRTQSFCSEDVASSLDMETEQVQQIINAMQGRVLESDTLMGWEKRQVAREDGASERAKAWREAKKQAKTSETNATERKQTQAERKQTPDKIRLDKDKDKKEAKASSAYAPPEWVPADQWAEFVQMRKAMRNIPFTEAAAMGVVSDLEKLVDAGNDPASMLTNAVTNGWRTVYPPKHGGTAQPNKQQALEDRNQAIARNWAEGNHAEH